MGELIERHLEQENAALKARVEELEGNDVKPAIDMMRDHRDHLQREVDTLRAQLEALLKARTTPKCEACGWEEAAHGMEDGLACQQFEPPQLTAQPDGVCFTEAQMMDYGKRCAWAVAQAPQNPHCIEGKWPMDALKYVPFTLTPASQEPK